MENKLKILFLLFIMGCLNLTSCMDSEEDLIPAGSTDVGGSYMPLSYTGISSTAGLVQQSDGTYRASRRVPLVGSGRIIDDIYGQTVEVAAGNSSMVSIVDLDLNNYTDISSGLLSVDVLGGPIFSVRDLHHTYQAGEKVGIVFKAENSSVLTLDLLKNFYINTAYTELNGEKTEDCEKHVFGGSSLLNLSLINIGGDTGLKELSFVTSKNFNEVQFGVLNIDAGLLKKAGLQIYYVFVGDNERQPAVRGSVHFPNAHIDSRPSWTRIIDEDHIVDGNLDKYAWYSTLGLLYQPCATVDFGRDVPAGWEVGYEISSADLLDVATGVILETYDQHDKKIDHVAEGKVLGLTVGVHPHRQLNLITTQPCRKAYILFPTGVKLGATRIYYAYARPKVEIDPSSIFSMPNEVLVDGNLLLLPTPEGGKTEWRIQSFPEGANPQIYTDETGHSTRIRRMTVDGDYVLIGSFTPYLNPNSGETPQPIQIMTTIRRKRRDPQITLITDKQAYFTTEQHGIYSGGLLPIIALTNQDQILDGDSYTYASTAGISVATNSILVNVKLKQEIDPKLYDGGKARAGFLVRPSFDFLNLNVLNNGLRVVLFHKGKKVADSGGKGLKGLKVGLLGLQGDRSKIYVEIDKPFDQVMLLNSGLAGVNLTKMRIYGVFSESTLGEVIGIEEMGIHLLSSMQHGARINYDQISIGSIDLAQIGKSGFIDLGKLVDFNNKSYATNFVPVGVASNGTFAVQFDEIPLAQQDKPNRVGVVLKNNTGLDADVLKLLKLQAFYKGKEVESIFLNLSVLNLDLSANAERRFFEMYVNSPIDELRLKSTGLIKIGALSVYGFYVRPDSDGDGVPDDTEENEPNPNPVLPLVIQLESDHICENQNATLKVSEPAPPTVGESISSQTDKMDKVYTVELYNKNTNKTSYIENRVLNSNRTITFEVAEAGNYIVRLKESGKDKTYSNPVALTVHPLRAKWTGEKDTDWNEWDNWENGSPWHCTDVIIPKTSRYPHLVRGGQYYCKNLHVYAHAEVVGSQYLQYGGRVWIDMSLMPGHTQIVTPPLKEMFTGDMFIPKAMLGNHAINGDKDLFQTLLPDNSPENRFYPLVHQSFWSCDVKGKIVDKNTGLQDQTVSCAETDWSASFNAVAEPYRPGVGFKIYASSESLNAAELIFRFPKMHKTYSYFNSSGKPVGYEESIPRKEQYAGHFIFEDESQSKPGLHVPTSYQVTLRNKTANGHIFVAGNPYIANLDALQFMKENEKIAAIHVYGIDGVYTVKRIGSELVTSNSGSNLIHPMQGFYVELPETQKQQEFRIRFTDAMQCQDIEAPVRRNLRFSHQSRSKGLEDALYIEVTNGKQQHSCMVCCHPQSSDAYQPNEDARLLYDKEIRENIAVFTVADQVALGIQYCTQRTSIPVGLRLNASSNVKMHLRYTTGRYWSQWYLLDTHTGKRYSLKQNDVNLDLGVNETSTDRYRLVKSGR